MDKTCNEKIIHTFNASLQREPGKCVLAVDRTNAFHFLDRVVSLGEVKTESPQTLSFIALTYAADSRAWYHGKPQGIDHIDSVKGLHQGCTSGTWAYSMGTLPMIKKL
jgi:hypothetical protein